ncbi:transglutaminase-like domain-containing protein [Isoptericola jiangsuensis]|uniref:transglutaminase-like domain-containing protein n=1 Tax=Isoptericola jiangsuensis TaxID=548579 RepID=UPI003AAD20EE
MRRDVSAHLTIEVTSAATLALAVTVVPGHGAEESLRITLDGVPVSPEEVTDSDGTRLHVVRADPGRLVVDYAARVHGRHEDAVTPSPTTADLLRFLRPSRYAESDSLGPTAGAEFAGLAGTDLLAAVSSWVGTRLQYVPGSSQPTDGAVQTLLARRGVCRDYAHLVVGLLRALDVPARLAAVYAPGLDPMDFHAVAEAFVDGAWHVVDATTLAPRSTLVRIAAGRDAADTAFLSVYDGTATLADLEVAAVADDLPDDDVHRLVRLG